MDAKLSEIARKHALANALDFGKASAGAVAGKVIAEIPAAKDCMKETMQAIVEQVAKVNSLAKEKIAEEIKSYTFKQKEPETEKKLSLPDAFEGKVVTRFPPEPNGYPHIGHAKAAWLNRKFADDWRGKCLLRFDDTNPETEKEEFMDAIVDGLRWLGVEFDGPTIYASDLMPRILEEGGNIVKAGKAYACTCSEQAARKTRETGVACACRGKGVDENFSEWKEMRGGKTEKGKAVLRFKGDLKSNNSVMRDPTLFRILDAEHYRQGAKYRCWPLYDFEAAVVDSVTGVTHALRSKEYELRDELYAAILDSLGLRKPVVYGFSRLALKGTALSKRLVKPLIESGKVSGWDDVRLPTIAGLRRRGLLPAAIKEFVLSFGLSKVESRPDWEALLSCNRKLLDAVCERRFFVANPVELSVEGLADKRVAVRNHPTDEKKGARELPFAGRVFVQKQDLPKEGTLRPSLLRLKELGVFEIDVVAKKAVFAKDQSARVAVVQWVPAQAAVEATVIKPLDLLNEKEEFNENSLQELKGVCEASCLSLKQGDEIQFERVGFCRLDDEKKMVFMHSC